MDVFANHPTISITAIVTLFAVIAVHRLTDKRNKAVEFRASAKSFRNTVLDELKEVYPVVTSWPDHPPAFFSSKFIALQLAVSEFETALPIYKKLLFRRAWRLYRVGKNPTSKKAEQDYFQYMGVTINDHYIDPRKPLKNNVDRLLKYAKK